MRRARHTVQAVLTLAFGAAAVLAAVSCSIGRGGTPLKALPDVSPAPSPSPPGWIAEYSPTGETKPLAQIRVIFRDPLIPLQALEDPSAQSKLARFRIDPPLPGRFRFLTPRMVGFQQDQALPLATRVRVTLAAGLSDLAGHTLDHDLSWSFTTAPLDISGVSRAGDDQGPVGLTPTIAFRSNVELDAQSLADHLALRRSPGGQAVPVTIVLDTSNTPAPSDEDNPQAAFDASTRSWTYKVTPKQTLAKATAYDIQIAPGLRPARGNLPSIGWFGWTITTYGPLAFQGLTKDTLVTTRFEGGRPVLWFNNPLVADSIIKNLSISPVPKSTAGLWDVFDGSRTVYVSQAWLLPRTTYTISIGAGVTDAFGQTLGTPEHVSLSTGDRVSDFYVPTGFNIFPAQDDLRLDISGVNLRNDEYSTAFSVVRPVDLVYRESAEPDASGGLLSGVRWATSKVTAKRNEVVDIAVPLRAKLGGTTGVLAYGATSPAVESPLYGIVQLTNLGVFAQWFPTQGLVRVQHLSDGSRVATAVVDVYPSRLYSDREPAARPCASGTTDATGTFWLDASAMAACIAGNVGSYGGPTLLAVAREYGDWAFARTQAYSGLYGYGIAGGWDDGLPQSRGTIFSDRALYQPGEKAWFTCAAYLLRGGVVHQDRHAAYRIWIENPSGTKTDLGVRTTDGYGMFSFPWTLRRDQPVGYYVVRAKGPTGVAITGDFRVAEFKPPNFKVTLSLDKDVAYPGDAVAATASAEYLFGSPVQGGQGTYYVTRQQTSYTPKGWEDYAFGRQWFWPEEPPTVSSDVLQAKQSLGPAGKFAHSVEVDATIQFPMTYRVDAQVVDASNLSVADSKSFTVLPSDALIGLRSDWVGTAGHAVPVSVIVADARGGPVRRRSVVVSLQSMKYASAAQLVEGGETDRDSVQYRTVATARIESGGSPQMVSLVPPDAGSYRIRANFADAKDDSTATDTQIWITGPQDVDWGAFGRDVLKVKLDKAAYRVGEVATALIQSPYPQADLYFAVVRDRVLYHEIATVRGGAPEVRFRVSPEMLPNAAVEAVLVRQGPPLRQLRSGSLDSLSRAGFAPFAVDLGDKYLSVSIASRHSTLEPGARQTVDLQVRDAAGRSVRAQAAVMVVNETVLQLTGYRPPDLVQTVYAPQQISTVFADNRPDVVLRQIASPLQKGWGYGGGFMAGAASTQVRTNFQALAYYDGALVTDERGHARFSFATPDDLTTWRVMAVAVAATAGDLGNGFRFGNSDATFVVSKPLVTSPLLPQFARPGDRLSAGLTAVNISGAPGTLQVSGVAGGPLAFDEQGGRSGSVTLSRSLGSQLQALRFPMVATGVGTAHVTFRSVLGSKTDAFEFPLQIRPPLSMMEQVVESGTTDGAASIPINVDPRVAADAGGLEIDLASTLVPQLALPALQTVSQSDLPFLEPAASRLIVSAQFKLLAQRYGQGLGGFDPAATAAAALGQLRKLQQADGGFAWLPQTHESDPFLSSYAGEAIAAAVSAGIQVDPAMVEGAAKYLNASLLADPCLGTEPCRSRRRLDVLTALADLGQPRTTFLSDIYDQRDSLDLEGQVELARYLTRLPAWQSQAAAMAAKIKEIVNVSGRYATINYPEEWGWLESPTAMRAQVLRLYIARNADPDFIDRLASSLLALRRNGVWTNSYENAQALTALVDYAGTQPTPPDFSATATLSGETLAQGVFRGYSTTSASRHVSMAQLPRGHNDVLLSKAGQGRLHYLVAYSYRLTGDQPGILSGLRVTREIRAANADQVIAHMGLNAPGDPLTLDQGQVFDIGLEIIADHPVDHVVITDELPAGLEAVDTTFKTSTPYFTAQGDSWEIDYQTIYKDRIVAYATRLEAGVYELHYLVRSVTPGTYLWPGADAHLEYAPEEFGRTSTSTLVVR